LSETSNKGDATPTEGVSLGVTQFFKYDLAATALPDSTGRAGRAVAITWSASLGATLALGWRPRSPAMN
jgi:hypothetical protein